MCGDEMYNRDEIHNDKMDKKKVRELYKKLYKVSTIGQKKYGNRWLNMMCV